MTVEEINSAIRDLSKREDKEKISDWYHTFWELYEHRCVLFLTVVNLSQYVTTWKPFVKSKIHFDWTSWEWYFIVQWYVCWKQISYHLPIKYRDKVLCKEIDIAHERDWHTSQDVLDRLMYLY